MTAIMQYQPMSLEETTQLGEVFVGSGFFADTKQAAQAIVKILAGQELGFGPMASMTGVNIIQGKVALSANLMAAAIKRSGRYNYRVLSLEDDKCEIAFMENGKEIGISAFTTQDAKKAGLSGQNWIKYPRNMLFARALSNGVKWYCPDLSGGPMYTPDELGETVDYETGEIVTSPNAQRHEELRQAMEEAEDVIDGVIAEPNGKPPGALEDDELAIYETQQEKFFDKATELIKRYNNPKAVMGCAKKLGYTTIPKTPTERVGMYTAIRDYASQRDEEDAQESILAQAASENPQSVHAEQGELIPA